MKFLVSICLVAVVALTINADTSLNYPFMWDLISVKDFALPLFTLYKDINRGNHRLTVYTLDFDDPFHCYGSNELGLVNAVSSQVDLYGNCLEVYEKDGCNGRSTKLTPNSPQDCLDFFINCHDNGGNWNDNIRSVHICKP